MTGPTGWPDPQPIETAPRDRVILVYCPHYDLKGGNWHVATWDAGNSAAQGAPRFQAQHGTPYNIPATHWVDQPPAPATIVKLETAACYVCRGVGRIESPHPMEMWLPCPRCAK